MSLLKNYKEIIFFIFSVSLFIFSVSFSALANDGGLVKGNEKLENIPNVSDVCRPLISHYLRSGDNNDSSQVRLLQSFLAGMEGFDVEVNGFFDQKTLLAVHSFQKRYATEILEPWGLSPEDSTGFVYYTTQNKINEIFCGKEIPLSGIQKADIQKSGGNVFALEQQTSENVLDSDETVTDVELSLADTADEDGDSVSSRTQDRIKEVAAAAFIFPKTPSEGAFYGLWFILILAVVYILGSLISGLKDSKGLSKMQIRMRKIVYFMVGTLIGLIIAVAFKLTAIVVPLIIVIIILSLGLLYYARKNS